MENLTAQITAGIISTLTQTGVSGVTSTSSLSLPQWLNAVFGSGIGANNINQLYTEQKLLAASASRTLVLSSMSNQVDPFGLAYSVANIKGLFLQIQGNLGATYVASVAVNNGGTATYIVGDTMTLATGTGTAATFKVLAVATGVITALAVLTPGSYTVNPSTSAVAITGGSGGGSPTVNITLGTVLTQASAVYTESDLLTIGNAGTNPWNAILPSTSTKLLKSGTNNAPGSWSEVEGGSTGYVVGAGSSEQLKIVNSGSNPLAYLLVLLGATG